MNKVYYPARIGYGRLIVSPSGDQACRYIIFNMTSQGTTPIVYGNRSRELAERLVDHLRTTGELSNSVLLNFDPPVHAIVSPGSYPNHGVAIKRMNWIKQYLLREQLAYALQRAQVPRPETLVNS